jgi:hypothetical protein
LHLPLLIHLNVLKLRDLLIGSNKASNIGMESYQAKYLRTQKTALPKIQSYYDPPVEYRFSSLSKKYGQTPTNLPEQEDLNLSMSEESLIEVEDASETNNKSSTTGSVNDLPPTRDSSKISFYPGNP